MTRRHAGGRPHGVERRRDRAPERRHGAVVHHHPAVTEGVAELGGELGLAPEPARTEPGNRGEQPLVAATTIDADRIGAPAQ